VLAADHQHAEDSEEEPGEAENGQGPVRRLAAPGRGIDFAISVVLFVVGAIPDNFLQSLAAALMIASTTRIAVAARHHREPARTAAAGDTSPAGSYPEVQQTRPAGVR